MALRGDLASVDLAQVFQMLALNKKVGLLSIHSAKLWKVLYFDERGVTVQHNVHRVLDRGALPKEIRDPGELRFSEEEPALRGRNPGDWGDDHRELVHTEGDVTKLVDFQ